MRNLFYRILRWLLVLTLEQPEGKKMTTRTLAKAALVNLAYEVNTITDRSRCAYRSHLRHLQRGARTHGRRDDWRFPWFYGRYLERRHRLLRLEHLSIHRKLA